MVRFLSLFTFTDQGAKKIAETAERAEAFQKLAQKAGATVKALYWTVGDCDGAVVLEAPDEQTALGLLAKLAALGNVRTHTMRAFDRGEIEPILAKAK